MAEKKNYNKKTGEQLPEKFIISTDLLNNALGFLAILPVYQTMELITKINMDIIPYHEEAKMPKDNGDIPEMPSPEQA